MKKFILGIVIGFLLTCAISYAYEYIADFSETSLIRLNAMIREIKDDIADHETRITALE